jgi:hypothetical protein
MHYAHSREKQKFRGAGPVQEFVLGGERGRQRGRRQFSGKIVDGELMYNDELTAS